MGAANMNPALLETVRKIERDDENPYFEIINGRIVMQRQKTVGASVLASRLAFELSRRGGANEAGYVVIRALFQLAKRPDLMRRPEVAFVSFERWPRSRKMSMDAIEWDVIPNLAVDIINPDDRAEETEARVADYFASGVELSWVLDPSHSEVRVSHSLSQVIVLSKNGTLDGGKVLPGFQLPLKDLFTE
jgi:Uma2 family endonuclease